MTRLIVKWVLLLAAVVLPGQRVLADDATHLFILSGQSNMRGPLPQSFRDCVGQVFGQDNVIVVTHARPSQPIKRWYGDWQPPTGMADENPEHNGTLYDELIRAVTRATRNREYDTVTFIWMQGEADANNAWSSVYEASFMGILDQFKRDLEIDAINFVVGRINDYWTPENNAVHGPQMRALQQAMGEANANGSWINTDDLNRGVNPWGGYSFADGHFPPAGYVVMGQRFARQACLLIDPDLELDEAIFREAFFDTSDDIATHEGVGMGATSDAQIDGLTTLTDGVFGQADAGDDAWVSLPPSDEAYVIKLDMGEVIAVDSVGINLLFDAQANVGVPARIVITTSVDGEVYTGPDRHHSINFSARPTSQALGELEQPATLLALTQQSVRVPTARYIRFEIQMGNQPVRIDELIVNPQAQAQP